MNAYVFRSGVPKSILMAGQMARTLSIAVLALPLVFSQGGSAAPELGTMIPAVQKLLAKKHEDFVPTLQEARLVMAAYDRLSRWDQHAAIMILGKAHEPEAEEFLFSIALGKHGDDHHEFASRKYLYSVGEREDGDACEAGLRVLRAVDNPEMRASACPVEAPEVLRQAFLGVPVPSESSRAMVVSNAVISHSDGLAWTHGAQGVLVYNGTARPTLFTQGAELQNATV